MHNPIEDSVSAALWELSVAYNFRLVFDCHPVRKQQLSSGGIQSDYSRHRSTQDQKQVHHNKS